MNTAHLSQLPYKRVFEGRRGAAYLGYPHAAAFRTRTAGAAVLAFSPSTLMMPALFRPAGRPATPFSDAEWALLEPATYVALLAPRDAPQRPVWTLFQR